MFSVPTAEVTAQLEKHRRRRSRAERVAQHIMRDENGRVIVDPRVEVRIVFIVANVHLICPDFL